MIATQTKWREVKKSAPCPACGKPDHCAWTPDGNLRCMRSEISQTPAGMRLVRARDKGGGAIYAPNDMIGNLKSKRAGRWAATPPTPPNDWTKLHREARARVVPGELDDLADAELGLPGEPLDALEVGVEDAPGSGWLFPERDGQGNVIGLVRRTPVGGKKALSGSRRGLTYQCPLPDRDPVLVVEGPSDTAAAIAAGFTAVGRPSNTGGGDFLAELLRGREIVICGENDRKPDGRWPGREGVEAIAKRLVGVCKSVRVMYPPEGVKDLRAWLAGGAQ